MGTFGPVLGFCFLRHDDAQRVFQKADAAVEARDYAQVAKTLDGPDSKKYYNDKDQVLRYLDSGMLYHLADLPDESIKRLETAERLIDENYTKSISNAAASFLINDYQLVYFGEAYEDLYVNVFRPSTTFDSANLTTPTSRFGVAKS